MKLTDEYIFKQPEKYRLIILHINDVVTQTVPNTTLLFKWGVPFFYYKNKPFCYLMTNHKKEFVDLSFVKGFLLKDNQSVLISENRKMVKSLRYYNLETINHHVLKSVILEAFSLYK